MSSVPIPPIRSESLVDNQVVWECDPRVQVRDQTGIAGIPSIDSPTRQAQEQPRPPEVSESNPSQASAGFDLEDPSLQYRRPQEVRDGSERLRAQGSREHDLEVRLESARREIESILAEISFLRLSHQSLQRSRDLLEQQHQAQIQDIQKTLSVSQEQLKLIATMAAREALQERKAELEEERERLRGDAAERLLEVGQRASERLSEQEERASERIRELEEQVSGPPADLPARGSQLDTLVELRRERDALLGREQQLRENQARLEEELGDLYRLLEDLPNIYEHKFQQRLQGTLEQQQLLFADNRLLRERLLALQPSAQDSSLDGSRLLLPSAVTRSAPQLRPTPLHRLLQGVRRFGSQLSRGTSGSRREPEVRGEFSDPDDGPPTGA